MALARATAGIGPLRLVSRSIFARHIRTSPLPEPLLLDDQQSSQSPFPGLATPRQLAKYLDQFVVGQENAKKVLSVAVFNHYTRVSANLSDSFFPAQDFHFRGDPPFMEDNMLDESGVLRANIQPLRKASSPMHDQVPFQLFEKSNVLVIGPTGSGKTLLVKTLARILDVPFSISDATSFTQAGYVGEDVDMAIQRLLQAAQGDATRASMGIVYIDEIDKIARRITSGTEGSRDVAGEGVQQALLRMMEGSVVTVQAKGHTAEIQLPSLEGQGRSRQRTAPPNTKPDTYNIDTTNILFILSGAFVGLDNIIKQRVSQASIGFSSDRNDKDEPLPFFTPNRKSSRDILELVDTTDLVKYGFIPEFISRLPSITTLSPLTIPDLRRILTEVKGSLVSQYQALFRYSGVEIRFTPAALEEICKKALARGGGARGLRGIMESLLLEPMYEVPGSDIRYVLITADVVRGKASPRYWRKGEAAEVAFFNAFVKDEQVTTLSSSERNYPRRLSHINVNPPNDL